MPDPSRLEVMDGDELIDTPEVARILGVTIKRVHDYIRAKRLPAQRFSNGTWVTTRRHAEKLRDQIGPQPRRPGPKPRGEEGA